MGATTKAKRTKPPPNPLPCGCGAIGYQDLENAIETGHSLHVPYKDIHVRHCPMHAAAPDLLAACKALLADSPYASDADSCECGEDGAGNGGTCCHIAADRAVAKAEGR